MEWFTAPGYDLARLLLQRGVALVYVLAFSSVLYEWRPLLGERGLTPVPRFTDRVPAYLNNLERLGLVWFSREEVEDHTRYQVLEAQPDVLAALRSHSRTKTVRKSLRTTPFGLDFARTALI